MPTGATQGDGAAAPATQYVAAGQIAVQLALEGHGRSALPKRPAGHGEHARVPPVPYSPAPQGTTQGAAGIAGGDPTPAAIQQVPVPLVWTPHMNSSGAGEDDGRRVDAPMDRRTHAAPEGEPTIVALRPQHTPPAVAATIPQQSSSLQLSWESGTPIGAPSCPALFDPQQTTQERPPLRCAHEKRSPTASSVRVTPDTLEGTVTSPAVFEPQHMTALSDVRWPQMCEEPTARSENAPAGTLLPSSSPGAPLSVPQHTMDPFERTSPHAWSRLTPIQLSGVFVGAAQRLPAVLPQHSGVPSTRSAHACACPTDTAVNAPVLGAPATSPLRSTPQHASELLLSTPHMWSSSTDMDSKPIVIAFAAPAPPAHEKPAAHATQPAEPGKVVAARHA